MTGAELIESTRVRLSDLAEPYLWSDDTILQYLNEGERHFCRNTHVLHADFTVTTVADQTHYDLDPRIARVLFCVSGGKQLEPYPRPASHMFVPAATAEPRAFSTGIRTQQLSLYPMPDDAYTVTVVAAVLPEFDIDPGADASIPAEYHTLLCDYAAFKCLLTNDVDGGNSGTATAFERSWHVGMLEAKRMQYLYRTPKQASINNWTGAR